MRIAVVRRGAVAVHVCEPSAIAPPVDAARHLLAALPCTLSPLGAGCFARGLPLALLTQVLGPQAVRPLPRDPFSFWWMTRAATLGVYVIGVYLALRVGAPPHGRVAWRVSPFW